MNKIVKYHNDLNKLSFTGFDQYDINLFWGIISEMYDNVSSELELSYQTVIDNSGIKPKDNKTCHNMILSMCLKLNKLEWNNIIDNESFDLNHAFRFRGNAKEKCLIVNVHNDFRYMVSKLSQEFTVFELKQFTGLSSKYSKNLYRIIKQWKSVGIYTFNDAEEFRQLMDVPKTYTNRDITEKIIKLTVKELENIFPEMTYEVLKARKRGAPVSGYKFTWTPEKRKKSAATLPDRSQDKPVQKQDKPKSKNKFKNFPEREYNHDHYLELERLAMQKKEPMS